MTSLKMLRALRSLTQAELAKALKIHVVTINQIELDRVKNTPRMIEKKQAIAEFFGVPVEEIFPDVES